MTIETANRLYELRKKKGLSQEELAERLGVSRQAVSKWERSEASPDTDNLIALARIYGLSLDELIYGERAEKGEPAEPTSEQSEAAAEGDGDTSGEAKEEESTIIVEDGGDTVKIDASGIFVKDKDGDTVKIGWKGLKINVSKNGDDDDDDDDGDGDVTVINLNGDEVNLRKRSKRVKFWLEVPYAIICVFAYLLLGFLDIWGGWDQAWILFITVPVYYSLVEAVYKKRFTEFSFPVLAAFIYLYFGMYLGNWHPSWLVFLTIPIYYPIAEAIDRRIRKRSSKESNGI